MQIQVGHRAQILLAFCILGLAYLAVIMKETRDKTSTVTVTVFLRHTIMLELLPNFWRRMVNIQAYMCVHSSPLIAYDYAYVDLYGKLETIFDIYLSEGLTIIQCAVYRSRVHVLTPACHVYTYINFHM